MPLNVGDLILIQVRGRLHQQRTITNLWYYNPIAVPAAEEVEVAIDFVTAWITDHGASYASVLSEEWEGGVVRGQLIRPDGTDTPLRWAYYQEAMTPAEGQVVQGSLPSSTCAVIRKRTALAGRSFRGRIYCPAVPTTFEEDSRLTEAAVTAYETAFADMLTAPVVGGGSSWEPCLTNAPVHTLITEINSIQVDDVLRTQRRREIGVGE